jgi:hypothetical protein
MTPLSIELELGALQELPATDDFAADEVAGVDLMMCRVTCFWITCLATCDVTEKF